MKKIVDFLNWTRLLFQFNDFLSCLFCLFIM